MKSIIGKKTKRQARKHIDRGTALVLCIVLVTIQCINTKIFAKDANNNFPYMVIETGNLIKQGSTMEVQGKTVQTEQVSDLHRGIVELLEEKTEQYSDKFVFHDNAFQNKQSIYSKKSMEIHTSDASLHSILYAKGDIQINCTNIRTSDYSILYSQNGSIYINTSDMQYIGLLYAPKGKVVINGTEVSINGSIISQETELYVNTFQITATEETDSIYQFLFVYQNDEIIHVGGAVNEDDSIHLSLDSNVKLESSDIYVRSDDERQFKYLETISVDEYELKNISFEETLDITAVGHTPYGDLADATMLSVGYDKENNDELCTLRKDSDGDGIADGVEIWYLQTNPYEKDTDKDGFDDYTEVFYLYTDPRVYTEDGDFDSDGLSNQQELAKQSNPYLKDSDFDGNQDSTDNEPLRYNENNNKNAKELQKEVDYTEKRRKGIFDRHIMYLDENGNIYQYAYNFINDNVQYYIENEKTTKYYYDLEENLTTVVIENGENSYAVTYRYQNEQITGVSHNGMNYDVEYNPAQKEEISNIFIAQKLYKHSVVKQGQRWEQYGNEDQYLYCYNDEGNLEKIYENDNLIFTYEFENGNIKSVYDCVNKITYMYRYDEEQNLKQIADTLGNQMTYEYDREYYKIIYEIGGKKKTHIIYYNSQEKNAEGCSAKLITGAAYYWYNSNDNQKVKSIQDKNKVKLENVYTFSNSNISQITYHNGDIEKYVYTKDYKLGEVYYNEQLRIQYEYDKSGQLIAEHNIQKKTSCRYIYDVYGNITAKKYYEYGTEHLLSQQIYTYDNEWTDQIKTIDGKKITYDAAGNPIIYTKGRNLQWTGRRLDKVETTDKTIAYTYNEEGIRNSKDINGISTDYVIEGEDIIYEKTGDNEIWYIYDANTEITGFVYNDMEYYYEKNAGNDVVALWNQSREKVCSYTYDAWGNLTGIEGDQKVAKLNKYRYKSYYYDEETGFYYLKSRYYDSETGRFLNPDCLEGIYQDFENLNLYVYCNNDPVNQMDPRGMAPIYLRFFYSSDMYKEDALACRTTNSIFIQQMKRGGNAKSYVANNKKDFINKWNAMTDATFVIILCHGEPQTLQFGGDLVKASELKKELKKKSVKALWLIGCNTGHFAYKDNNVASVMAQKINGVVVAPDGSAFGTTTINDWYKKEHFGAYVSDKNDKGEWKKWNDKGKGCYKTCQGWLLYQKKKDGVHLTITGINNTISIFSLSSYLVGHRLISYK